MQHGMNCQFLSGTTCQIATGIADKPAATNPGACAACSKLSDARTVNSVTLSMALSAVATDREAAGRIMAEHGRLIPIESNGQTEEVLREIRSGTGPGSHLWRLLEGVGVKHSPTCKCVTLARQMNGWGSQGCKARRAEIIENMRTNADAYGWKTLATATAKAVLTGLAWRLNPLDLYGSLVDEAVRRSAAEPVRPPIDILLPLGPGSRYGNVEVRMAIRSIEKHAVGLRRIVIVGQIPAFLRETDRVQLVSLPEFKCNKASRISLKVRWAFEHLQLTDRVAFWNDDYLLLRDFDIRGIPDYYHGELWRKRRGSWHRLLQHTGEALKDAGYTVRHFDIHIPIIYERSKFLAISDWWDRSRRDKLGLVAKSVYGNIHCRGTAASTNDAKVQGEWRQRVDDLSRRRWIASYGDGALAAGLADWMQSRWPTLSDSEVKPAAKVIAKPKQARRSARRRRAERCC
jgi:hypothetical protein